MARSYVTAEEVGLGKHGGKGKPGHGHGHGGHFFPRHPAFFPPYYGIPYFEPWYYGPRPYLIVNGADEEVGTEEDKDKKKKKMRLGTAWRWSYPFP